MTEQQHLLEQEEEPDVSEPKKESPDWKYFKIGSEENKVSARKVECTICHKYLSRSTVKEYSFGTSSMWKHLRTMHPRTYGRMMKEQVQPSEDNTTPAVQPQAGPSTSTATARRGDMFCVPDESPYLAKTIVHCATCHMPLAIRVSSFTEFLGAIESHHC